MSKIQLIVYIISIMYMLLMLLV